MVLPPAISSRDLARHNGALPPAPSPAPPSSSSSAKCKLRLTLEKPLYRAGETVRGTLEISVTLKRGATLAINEIWVVLEGLSELRSRTHTSTRRLLTQRLDFQGGGRPPSAATEAGAAPLQGSFYPALPGRTRFPIVFTIPEDAPSSCTLGGNATVRYELRAFTSTLVEGNVDIKSEKTEVQVVERWKDWRNGQWMAEGGVERKAEAPLKLGGDGKVELVASVGKGGEEVERPLRLFWRRELEKGVEGKPVVRVQVRVRNASKRHVTGLKLTLVRRLRLLPPPGSSNPPDAPLVSQTILTSRFHGADYDVAAHSERDVQLALQVPPDEECWTVRRAGLFELDLGVRVEVECGFLSNNLLVDLPIWIAHPHSLPDAAHRLAAEEARRLGAPSPHPHPHPHQHQHHAHPPSHLPAPPPSDGLPYHRPVSPGPSEVGFHMPHSPSSTVGFGQYQQQASPPPHQQGYYPSPYSASDAGTLPLPGTPAPPSLAPSPSHPAGFYSPAPPGNYAETTISLSPSVSSPAFYHSSPSPAPSAAHFAHPPPPPPSLSQVYHHLPFSASSAGPEGGYVAFNPSAPDLTPSHFLGALREAQPSAVAAPTPSHEVSAGSILPVPTAFSPPPTCPSPAPSGYSAAPQPALPPIPQRRDEEPATLHQPQATPPRPCPSPVPSFRSASRASRVTPPPPSPSTGASGLRRSPSPAPISPTGAGGAEYEAPGAAMLETIGEDGESQAGTARSGMLPAGFAAALKKEGEEAAEQERREKEREEKQARRRSVAEDLERWVEVAEEEEKEKKRLSSASASPPLQAEKTLPPLPPPSPSPAVRPTAKDVFAAEPTPPAPPTPSTKPRPRSQAPPPRDPAGLSALEARLLARSPSPSKPSSPPLPPPSPTPSAAPAPAALALPSLAESSALRQRSISRASRLVEDEALRKALEEAERDPGEAVRRAAAGASWRKELPKTPVGSPVKKRAEEEKSEKEAERASPPARYEPFAWQKEKEKPVEVAVPSPSPVEEPLKTAIKQEDVDEPLLAVKQEEVDEPLPRSPQPSPRASPRSLPPTPKAQQQRPVFSSTASWSSARRSPLPTPPSPVKLESTEEPFVPPSSSPAPTPAAIFAASSSTKPAPVAVLKRGGSPLPPASKPNPWSSSASLVGLSSLAPASPTTNTAAAPRSPASPVDPSGRKVVDPIEHKDLKRDALSRIGAWLDKSGEPDAPASTVGVDDASAVNRKRRTIDFTRGEFGRAAPPPPSSSSNAALSPSLGSSTTRTTSSTNVTSLSSGSRPVFKPSHKHSLSVPIVSSIPPPSSTTTTTAHAGLTAAQQLASETREQMQRAQRIGSPPPWSPSKRAAVGSSAVVKGAEGYLAALRKDERGFEEAKEKERDGVLARKTSRGGKVGSVVSIWAERVEEAARDGPITPPLPPSVFPSARRSAKSLSLLPHSATSPSLSRTNSPATFTPLSASTSARPLGSSGVAGNAPTPTARLYRSISPSSVANTPRETPRSTPAKPFLNTTLGRPSSSNTNSLAATAAAALRVPSGSSGKLSASESARALGAAAREKKPVGGNRVKDLLARYQAQFA